MAGDLVAKELVKKDNEHFDLAMDDLHLQSVVRQFVALDKELIREKASKNRNLKEFVTSQRFLLEYARQTGCTDCLPPMEYLEKQNVDGGFKYRKNNYSICLKELVFDQTRHGFAIRKMPLDANHGVTAVQDLGGCVAPCELNNVFVLENMNVPVCRFDPLMFCQSWMLAVLRPKFVFRGMIACPEGDYGLARMIVEVGNSKGTNVRSEVSVPFKKGDGEKLGRFIPFEVESPEYSFRPNHVFFFVCLFYVNQNPMPIRGMRIANCTVQCVLPNMPESLDAIECTESFPAANYDNPLHTCNYTIETHTDPEYLRSLKSEFYSVLDNTCKIRAAETARAEREIEDLMSKNILEDKMDVEESEELPDMGEKRKRSGSDPAYDGDEPAAKKKC